MENAEWQQLVRDINLDVGGIIRGQRTLEEVNEELRGERVDRLKKILSTRTRWGTILGFREKFEVDGVEIETRMLHRRGMHQRDVKGADLLYEIAGRKFVLIQYKTPNRNRVKLDRRQLKELMGACPNACPPHVPGFWPTCGAWYAVRSTGISAYVPACKAEELFDDADSCSVAHFGSGLSHETFQQVFARCFTGARIAPMEMAYLSWQMLEADRVLFTVLQRGSFGAIVVCSAFSHSDRARFVFLFTVMRGGCCSFLLAKLSG